MPNHVMVGDKQFVEVTSFKDEEGKIHSFFKPAICFFDHRPIIKFEGWESDSLCIHSLDGNHENMAPENKEPAHIGCHSKFHNNDRNGEKNPMFEVHRYGKDAPFFGKKHKSETIEKIREANLGEKNPMNTEIALKVWKTRRERYGPTGIKRGGEDRE